MDCQEAYAAMDDWMGETLSIADAPRLGRHLEQCAACREEWERRRGGMEALAAASDAPAVDDSGSLWNELEARLPAREPPARCDTSAGFLWLPVVAAAAMLLFAVCLTRQGNVPAKPHPEAAHRGTAPTRNLRFADGPPPGDDPRKPPIPPHILRPQRERPGEPDLFPPMP